MPIGYGVANHIATLTIDGQSDHNPMTPEMYLELDRFLIQMDEDPEVRVGILHGAGGKHFSAGGNLKRTNRLSGDLLTTEAILQHYWYPLAQDPISSAVVWPTILDRRTVKPVIAAVNGYCVGAALIVLGLHTDLRIAGESARFGMPEAKVGLGGGGDVASRLARQIPRTALLWMIETASFLDAQAAWECFLVNEVVPDDQVMARAHAVAEMVAQLPPLAVRAEKTAAITLEDVQFDQAVVLASGLAALTELSEDAREGVAAYREGRAPVFRGR